MKPDAIHAGLLSMLIAAVRLCLPAVASAQGGFTWQDGYDFRGEHAVVISGQNIADLTAAIFTPADFGPLFKLRAKAGTRVFAGDGSLRWVCEVAVDMDDDGSYELVTTDIDIGGAHVYSLSYGSHPVKLHLTFRDITGGCGEERTFWTSISVLPPARPYVNAAGDVLLQMRNEPAADRVPILLVEGIDVTNTTFPDTYYLAERRLIDDVLYPGGYEVFVLNFHDASRDLRLNAEVLRGALSAIHGLCPNSRIAVVGISMGGVIARYALAQAEAEGAAHDVGLFISYDAPQRLAHANRGLQDWIASKSPGNQAIGDFQAMLRSQAAKQMLDFDVYDPTNSQRRTFQDELRVLNGDGFPHQSRNVAISNGALSATWGVDKLVVELAHMKVYDGDGATEFETAVSGEPRDVGPGSLLSTIDVGAVSGVFWAPPLAPWPIYRHTQYYSLRVLFAPVFMPTWSTLDLVGYRFERDDDEAVREATSLVSLGTTRFDDWIMQTAPIPHNGTSATNDSALVHWLNRTVTVTISYSLPQGGTLGPEVVPVNLVSGGWIAIPARVMSVNGRRVRYVFQSWDDGDTHNPRKFYSPRDTSLSVTMRGPSFTSTSSGSEASNSPRIADTWDTTGVTTHTVYESGGSIWYLRKHDDAWDPEAAIADAATDCLDPTVAAQSPSWWTAGQPRVHAAWLRGNGSVVYNWALADGWHAPIEHVLGCAQPLTVLLADPKCDRLDAPYPCWPPLIWVDGGCPEDPGWRPPGVYYMKNAELGTYYHLLPGAEGNVSAGAVAYSDDCPCGYRETCTGYRLAFVRDGRVYTSSVRDQRPNSPEIPPELCSSAMDLTTAGWTAASPSIVSTDGSVFIAWGESNGSSHRIAFKERVGGGWSSTVYFAHMAHVAKKPVIGMDRSCGTLNLLWECGDHVGRVSRALSGTGWNGVADLGVGRAPSIAGDDVSGAIAMWTSGTAGPYAINVQELTPCSDVTAPAATPELHADYVSDQTVHLVWTAGGDDGMSGTAAQADLRYSRSPILTDSAFGAATPADPQPVPVSGGSQQGHTVRGLTMCTQYYFALKFGDESGNWSALGDTATGITGGIRLGNQWICDEGDGGGLRARLAPNEAFSAAQRKADEPAAIANVKTPAPAAVVPTRGGTALVVEADPGPDGLDFTLSAVADGDKSQIGGGGVQYQVLDGNERWITRVKYDLPEGSRVALLAPEKRGRWVFVDPVSLQAVFTTVGTGGGVWQLKRALHSAVGDVTDTLAIGALPPSLSPGDTLTAHYAAVPSTGGVLPSWLLLLDRPSIGMASAGSGRSADKPGERLPAEFALRQNQPNPFEVTTTFRFDLPRAEVVRLEVFDLMGRKVVTLRDAWMPAGQHSLDWDRRDASGALIWPGAYLYRLTAGSFRLQRKLVVLP